MKPAFCFFRLPFATAARMLDQDLSRIAGVLGIGTVAALMLAATAGAQIYSDNFDDNTNTGWTYLDRSGGTTLMTTTGGSGTSPSFAEQNQQLEQTVANYTFPIDALNSIPSIGGIALSGSGVVTTSHYAITVVFESLEPGNNNQDHWIVFAYEDEDNFIGATVLGNNLLRLFQIVDGESTLVYDGVGDITFSHDPTPITVEVNTASGAVWASYGAGPKVLLATGLTIPNGQNGVGSNNDAYTIDNYSIVEVTDITAPSWTATYPQADTETVDGFTARAATNEPGTAYYVVVADGATPPTSVEVKAGTGSGGSGEIASGSIALSTADTENTAAVTGLASSTAYDVYFVAEDGSANLQASPQKVDITTTLAAITLNPSFDSIGRFKASGGNTDPVNASTGNLGVGPVSGSDDYFRSYLTFDLSGESTATGESVLTLSSTGFTSRDEANDLELEQTFTLYALASDWDGTTAPGPNPGTILGTVTLTITTGDDTQYLSFSSAALTTAFNNAVGGNLYLGILSDGEGLAPAANDRSFKWFGSSEDPGAEPTLTYVAAAGGETFTDWISGKSGVGGQSALGDDPDGDGNDNGVENFFGTEPGIFSEGLVVTAVDTGAGTFTFTHPQGSLASDLTAGYQWSTDLAIFHDDGASSGGTTVNFSTVPDPVVAGTPTTVTAAVTGTAIQKLFVRVEVTQN
ncbi:hypothetical protein [Haloferula sp. A504]|uniref:hypothetical protein n=1 Tax=Haloferula sp. A504 TaxID=3373601 RepID=UPI0031C840F5|nr:hypothetical protein [Verrucomicrobiaceae bacterium E54]